MHLGYSQRRVAASRALWQPRQGTEVQCLVPLKEHSDTQTVRVATDALVCGAAHSARHRRDHTMHIKLIL